MPSLSETQALFRDAVVSRQPTIPPILVAPGPLAGRLAIYRRHFREALVRHLAGRFPTVEWLIGSDRFIGLAEQFVRVSPPSAPCMAEYGTGFVNALRWDEGTSALPYLEDVAGLDWALGDVTVAVDHPSLAIAALAAYPSDRLPDLTLRLQPGLRYLRSGWPVDELVRIRLGGRPPDRLHFVPAPVALEIRGVRGAFHIGRIEHAALEFRSALTSGETLGAAIEGGLDVDPEFDVSAALAALFAEGLVTKIAN